MELLENGIKKAGIDLIPITNDSPYIRWLFNNRNIIKIIHFHWLHTQYQRETRKDTILNLLRLIFRLLIAKIIGYRIIWTVHNLYPHEMFFPIFDKTARIFMAKIAHSVIVHCEKAKEELSHNFFRRKNVFVIPLGIYPKLSEEIVNTAFVKECLGIPKENLVFLFFGNIRPYKNVDYLISQFNKINDSSITLLIAGHSQSSDLQKELYNLVGDNKRIRFIIKWLENFELHQLLSCADVVALPFKKILTSSTVMLSLSYGKPIIAPDLGCLSYLIDNQTGFLYNPSKMDGLSYALKEAILNKDKLVEMGQNCLIKSEIFSWDQIGKLTVKVYQGNTNIQWS